jgi:hypothetical protein
MNRIIGFDEPLRGEHLAHSALPDAPVVEEREHPQHPHTWTASVLRAFARTTDRIANRLDPACA